MRADGIKRQMEWLSFKNEVESKGKQRDVKKCVDASRRRVAERLQREYFFERALVKEIDTMQYSMP